MDSNWRAERAEERERKRKELSKKEKNYRRHLAVDIWKGRTGQAARYGPTELILKFL